MPGGSVLHLYLRGVSIYRPVLPKTDVSRCEDNTVSGSAL